MHRNRLRKLSFCPCFSTYLGNSLLAVLADKSDEAYKLLAQSFSFSPLRRFWWHLTRGHRSVLQAQPSSTCDPARGDMPSRKLLSLELCCIHVFRLINMQLASLSKESWNSHQFHRTRIKLNMRIPRKHIQLILESLTEQKDLAHTSRTEILVWTPFCP